MIYLYLKTHNDTGLKYLGKTEEDPFTYPGSGIDWVKHLEVHGNNVSTEILFKCECKEDFKKAALKKSLLLDVVNSDDFANRVHEEGQGGGITRGWTCITDGKVNKRIPPNTDIPVGWRRGMFKCQHGKMRWINDGNKSKLIAKDLPTPNGFVDGRIIPKGKIWITDGKQNTKIKSDGAIPAGWRRGKCGGSVKGMIWINNGLRNSRISPTAALPEGWVAGKLIQ